jgi:hypothetical protein
MINKAKIFLYRAIAFSTVFIFLVLYLYLIQNIYESPKTKPFYKLVSFAGIIFGGGLTWDFSKFIFFLEIESLISFIKSIYKAFLWLFAYYFFSILTILLTGVWAGPQTSITPFTAIIAIFSCFKMILSYSKAFEVLDKSKQK